MGLYFKRSIAFLYVFIIALYFILNRLQKKNKKLNFLNPKRYLKYIKLVINKKILIFIILSSIISNSILLFQNKRYNSLYNELDEVTGQAIIISNKEEKNYNNVFKIKIISINNSKKYQGTYLYLKISKNNSTNLEYGDKIYLKGNFIEPDTQRNYGGFNYKEYLKTLKIYGTIKANNVKLIEKDKGNIFYKLANFISNKVKEKLEHNLNKDIAGIVKGIILGDKNNIENDIQENFKISGISHILAVSGMHVSYLIMGINLLLKRKIGKRKTRFFIIVFLILYMFLTGFSPSIVRAGIMGILFLSSEVFHRKSDIATSISLSLLLILIYNPFLLENIGLQFSYLATMGIILFRKNVKNVIKEIKIKNKKWKYKIKIKAIKVISKIQDILSVTISAQLFIFPVMIYHFNIFGTYFLFSNLAVSFIIEPILIISVLNILLGFIFNPFAKLNSFILNLFINVLIFISNISQIPFSKIYLPTPNIVIIVLYYIILGLGNIIFSLYNTQKLNTTQIRMRNLIALFRFEFISNRKKYLIIFFILFLIFIVFKLIPKDLKIYFVDVGQGDSTFIITPYGKSILIDGGGSETKDYDVGKDTLLPYLLDRGYTKIDYIIISHFDNDHVRTDY